MRGIYIHIPFCAKKCPYCDFYSAVGFDFLKDKYIAALRAELEILSNLYDLSAVKTLYFGGGTPSSLPPALYEKLFRHLSEFITPKKLEEITIEVNPESYTLENFKALKGLGFNRVSVGVQSFDDKTLKVLGRTHDAKTSLVTLENLHRAGFENISVDLIWGVPNQSPEDLKREIEVLKNTPAVHLSAYKLTLYEDTPLYHLASKGRFRLPSEEVIENLYYTLLEETEKIGFGRYEISNFAKSEKYFSKHNLLYWKLEPFLGLGASAWSFDGKRRWANPPSIERYLEKLNNPARSAGVDFIAQEIVELDERELLKERIIMGLRTTEGVERVLIEDKLPREFLEEFFILKGNKIAFNDRGFLVSNFLLSEILRRL